MSWTRANSSRIRALLPIVAGGALGIAALAGPRSAYAQEPSGDAALAETLFDDAKRDMASGKFVAACPKLAESYRLDPGTGTLTALALCHENTGRTASAWTEFIEVVTEARQASRADREKFAEQHIRALEAKLSKLTIQIEPSLQELPGLEVRRDGSVVGPAGWSTAAPVDPGEHSVEVRAPGKKVWSLTLQVGPDGDQQMVRVPPALEDLHAEDAPGAEAAGRPAGDESASPLREASDDSAPPAAGHTQRIVGATLAGVGLAAAGVGTYFGLIAISKNGDATSRCGDPNRCTDPTAVSLSRDARSAAAGADIALGAAAALLTAGALVYFLAPASVPKAASASSPVIAPTVSSRGGAIALTAWW